jgi:hypothetical protein
MVSNWPVNCVPCCRAIISGFMPIAAVTRLKANILVRCVRSAKYAYSLFPPSCA